MLVQQVRSGDTSGAVADVRSWLWSENQFCGLTANFAEDFTPELSDLNFRAEVLDDSLAKKVFDPDGLDVRDATYLDRLRRIWEAGFENGFVAGSPLRVSRRISSG